MSAVASFTKALAFEDRHDAARDAKPLEDRGRGDGVGRGDDGPEDERAGPAETGNQLARNDGDDPREQQEHELDLAHAPPRAAEAAESGS